MKRLISLLLALAMLALLGGCFARSTTELSLWNTELTVEYETNRRGTITTADGDVYTFHVDRRNGADIYEITYPNGKTYSNEKRITGFSDAPSTQDGDGISIGISINTAYVNAYEGDEYIGTATLVNAIELSEPPSVPMFSILLSLALIVGGIVTIVKSHGIMEFRLEIRNWHKNPEMRELTHARTVYLGIATTVLGFILLIITALSAVY